jgi:1-aminocyclopropane-1-carboxylate deaminase/D-cysteine desulfhydrase-like pyridoxal-dependent ACC family enzyme
MAPSQRPISPAQLDQAIARLPRYQLAHLPTPLEFLPRFSRVLGGPRIFIKRDDCTGLAFGGNKARHNEFLLGAALEQGADMLVWGAGVQSNNCRQTAAACAKAGLDCTLLLGRGHAATEPDVLQGNLLLDHLVGAMVEIVDEPVGPALEALITARAAELKAAGRKVYAWDSQTVKPLAAVSYALCLAEIIEQAERMEFAPDALYVCSAGSTGAGLVLGKAALGQSLMIRNIAPIEWPWDTQADMARIAEEAAALLGLNLRFERSDIDVTFDYLGPGYGKVSPGCLEAMALLARTEGILLDPIYSGKALAGLIDHVRRGKLTAEQNVVFVHTGGTPAIFAYNTELGQGIAARRM